MPFGFRLTLYHKTPGFFRFDAASTTVECEGGPILSLVARNADTLAQATSFHFEAGGFHDEVTARQAGERLRLRLRFLNSKLGLGVNLPLADTKTGGVSDEIKQKVLTEHGGIAMDTVQGLSVFPDDGKHFEYVVGGHLNVYPSDSAYVLKALAKIWALDMTLDEPSEDALTILGLAETEASPRAKFLVTYLALEPLIETKSRSASAITLIESFQSQVAQKLPEAEANSLISQLSNLREQAFTSALRDFVGRVQTPTELGGRPIQKFISDCIEARNRIAHKAALDPNIKLEDLTAGLRDFVLMVVWTNNRIPSITLDVPPSAISVSEAGITVRVL